MARSIAALRYAAVIGASVLLAACGGSGGGGGGVATTPPPPAPTPTPVPTPTPTQSAASFNTPELRRSDGPEQHGAVTAWVAGATGRGATIAIVDSGIDSDSPEFAGRIHASSTDLVANRGIDGEDDHGTNVALVAAAARNNSGVVGVAFDASLLVLRGDTVGSCGTDTPSDTSQGCTFSDSAIARGIDIAVGSGARVVNLSLGGGSASQVLRSAVARASAAGVVVVVAAGNDGAGDEPGVDPNEPDPFARAIREAGGNNVIIVGSVDANNAFSTFSQRAGSQAAFYLTARGERVCCVYENGQILQQGNSVLVFSGTSFATPQVAGAVALLAQAFPNLTGAQIVEILLASARDAGAAGTDSTFGRGILDIAAAFAPRGATTLAGGTTAVAMGDRTAVGSPAMGDALSLGQSLTTVVLDSYQRAYGFDAGAGLRSAVPGPRLHGALNRQSRRVATAGDAVSLAFTIAPRGEAHAPEAARPLRLTAQEAEAAQVLAGRVAARIAPGTQIGFAFAEGADGLAAQLRGAAQPAFLIARDPRGDVGFAPVNEMSWAVRHELGRWGLTVNGERSGSRLGMDGRDIGPAALTRDHGAVRGLSFAADRRFGPIATTLGLNWLDEERGVLGAWLHPGFGASGADTVFVDANAAIDLAADWRLGAAYRHGHTRVRRSGLIATGSDFASNAWSFDLTRTSSFVPGDSVGVRLAQPLRVTSGGIGLELPVSYDYVARDVGYEIRRLSLSPKGRELVGEATWRGPLWWGEGSFSVYYRADPGHHAAVPADVGAALTWRRGL